MIYTCYEMVRDCRAGLPAGWTFFAANYVPVVQKVLAHYAPDGPALLDPALSAIRTGLFSSLEPAPERSFVAALRQYGHAQLPAPAPEIPIDLESVAAALQPLTVLEKQAAWIETMRYGPSETAAMLRVAPETVSRIRERAGDLIRQHTDAWRRGLLTDNGLALGRAAAAAEGKDCLAAKTFLDIIDGRMTWRGRDELERHAGACWHCIDHFCRMLEVIEVMRGIQPLAEAEAAPLRQLLGTAEDKRPGWKRFFG